MRAISKKYTYNHVHDATLLQDIMKELAGADGVHELKDAPAPRHSALSCRFGITFVSNDGLDAEPERD